MKPQFLKNLQQNQIKRQQGLTLIELLVVVALLLLIMVAIFRVFGTDIAKSRDAQRKKDLKTLKISMEDYYNDHDAYPPEDYFTKANCGSTVFAPYIKKMPCDPITGEPYLYIPVPGAGNNTLGYRILSRLDNDADPVISEAGCVGGCIIDHPNYVYGISEGVPLSNNGSGIVVPPSISPEEYCQTHTCFCCSSSGAQDCSQWSGGISTHCDEGPFGSAAQCYSQSSCRP